jgi:hypothetical protein
VVGNSGSTSSGGGAGAAGVRPARRARTRTRRDPRRVPAKQLSGTSSTTISWPRPPNCDDGCPKTTGRRAADVLLLINCLRYALPGWDGAEGRRDAQAWQEGFYESAQAWEFADSGGFARPYSEGVLRSGH